MRPALISEWTDGTVGEWPNRDEKPNGTERPLPVIQDVSEILERPIVPKPDVIEGVLREAGKMAVGSYSKSRKTWEQMNICVSVATGTECLNGYRTQKGRVLYVNFELPPEDCAWRFQQICEARQLEIEKGMLNVLNLRGYARAWALIKNEIPQGHYKLIDLDPSYKMLWGKDENKTSDVALLMEEFDVLAERTGAAVMFTQHFPKGSQAKKEAIDRLAGSGAFARDADSILTFTSLTTEDCYAVELTARLHKPIPKYAVRWQFPRFVVDPTLDPDDLKQVGGRPAVGSDEQLLSLIKDKALRSGKWKEKANEEYGISERTFYRMKDSLQKRGLIERFGWQWSPK